MPALYIGALVVWGIALARWDFAEHRLPDRLTLPAYPAAAAIVSQLWPAQLGIALVMGVIALAIAATLHVTVDLGGGDVKLLGIWGILAGGSGTTLDSIALIALLGGLHALLHVLITRDRRSHIPFGPAILVGFLPATASMW